MLKRRLATRKEAHPATWVVVAESARARVFAFESVVNLREIATIIHPQGRMREQKLTSDRQGRTFDSTGSGRHAKQDRISAHEQECIGFASAIAACLKTGRMRGKFQRLILIAPPHFLGLLRTKIDAVTARRITRQIAKNITLATAATVRRYV